jgi:hypothetical protein
MTHDDMVTKSMGNTAGVFKYGNADPRMIPRNHYETMIKGVYGSLHEADAAGITKLGGKIITRMKD